MAPEVGSEAPDFTVKDHNNQKVTLSSFRGERAVLLVFYPFAFSGLCTGELCAVRDALKGGVEAAQIVDGRVPHSVLMELFTEDGLGTKVTAA